MIAKLHVGTAALGCPPGKARQVYPSGSVCPGEGN